METSGRTARGITVRVFISGENAFRAANVVASKVENTFNMKGSTIYPMSGRWHGNIEPGCVVEVTKTRHNEGALWPAEVALRLLRKPLNEAKQETGLTFYVTATESQVMEVF